MVAFQPSQIPPSCQTVEQLAVWAITTLNNLNPDLTYTESLDSSGNPVTVRRAQAAVYQLTATRPSVPTFIGKVSIPLLSNYQAAGTSLWASAQPIDTAHTIPQGFTGAGT